MRKTIAVASMALFLVSLSWAQDKKSQKMIHIDFKDSRPDGVEMVLSVPITVLESFQPQIRQAFNSLAEENQEIDFYEIWRSVKETGPTDFLEVKGKDGHIKISTTETHLVALVDSPDDGLIEATVPLILGDALFGEEAIMDLEGLVAALELLEGQDLVKIQSDHINARVWIQ